MKINKLTICEGINGLIEPRKKVFNFGHNFNLIYSSENSVGKTTLVRSILFSLGFNIPNTKLIKFEKMTFEIELVTQKNENIVLIRNGDSIELSSSDKDILNFQLPLEQNKLHSIIFGEHSQKLLESLLGIFYFDQETGWDNPIRKLIIGNNRLNIQKLLLGVTGEDTEKLEDELKQVENEISKFKTMRNLSEYQEKLNSKEFSIVKNTQYEELMENRDVLNRQIFPLEKELRYIDSTLRKNKGFVQYVENLKLRIRLNDNVIVIKKENLEGIEDLTNLLKSKKELISQDLKKYKTELKIVNDKITKNETELVNLPTVTEMFDSEIGKIKIPAETVEHRLTRLSSEKKILNEKMNNLIRKHDKVIISLKEDIIQYSKDLGIDGRYINPTNDFLFRFERKYFSGAKLSKIVFAFKMAYIKMVERECGLVAPIIIDSPHGKEVNDASVAEMMKIVESQFPNHQVILASIFNNYSRIFTEIKIGSQMMDNSVDTISEEVVIDNE